MFSTLFTVTLPEHPGVGFPVLGANGTQLLIINPNEESKLRWVEASDCSLGSLYLNQDQREWWKSLAPPDHLHGGEE